MSSQEINWISTQDEMYPPHWREGYSKTVLVWLAPCDGDTYEPFAATAYAIWDDGSPEWVVEGPSSPDTYDEAEITHWAHITPPKDTDQ